MILLWQQKRIKLLPKHRSKVYRMSCNWEWVIARFTHTVPAITLTF